MAEMMSVAANRIYGAGALCHSAAHGGGSGQACKLSMYEWSRSEALPSRVRDAKRLRGIPAGID